MSYYKIIGHYMRYVLHKANIKNKKEVPVYALLLDEFYNISHESYNIVDKIDVTAHAEKIIMIKTANKIGYRDLSKFYLITSLEPCDMCQEICRLYRLNKVYFSAFNMSKYLNTPKTWVGGIYHSLGYQILKHHFLNYRKICQ